MTGHRVLLAALVLALAPSAMAGAPSASVRPLPRPAVEAAPEAWPRPRPRPEPAAGAPAAAPEAAAPVAAGEGPALAADAGLRPRQRPAGSAQPLEEGDALPPLRPRPRPSVAVAAAGAAPAGPAVPPPLRPRPRPLPAAAAPAAPAAPAPAALPGAVPAAEGAAAPADPAAAAAVAASVAPPAAGVEEAVAAAIHAPTRGDATAAEPAAVAVAVPPAAPLPVGPALRPRPRPATAAVEVTRAAIAPALSPLAVLSSARPRARPAVLRRPPRAAAAAPPVVQASAAAAGVRVQPDPAAIVGRPGALCGTDGLQGRALPPVASSVRGCGIANPVRLTSVAGVALSPNPVLDCDTARALHRWVTIAARPAVGGTGGGIAELTIGSHYACRPRNNRPGARISEHGRGRAIDIMTIRLKDGQVMNVLRDFRSGPFSAPLKAMHRAACGIFGTTLGPGSDRYHENHFHYDTARHRSGAYCR